MSTFDIIFLISTCVALLCFSILDDRREMDIINLKTEIYNLEERIKDLESKIK